MKEQLDPTHIMQTATGFLGFQGITHSRRVRTFSPYWATSR